MVEKQKNTQVKQEINRHFLRYLREIHELSPEQLAQKINVEPELVETWEAGRRQPNQKHQISLERLYGIRTGALAVNLKHLLLEDFSAAYFGDEDARSRLNWVSENRKLAQTLDILPSLPKKRVA